MTASSDSSFDSTDGRWIGTFVSPPGGSTSATGAEGVGIHASFIPATGERFVSYSMDFGDGSTPDSDVLTPDPDGTTSLDLHHAYSAAEEYTVKLTVRVTVGVAVTRSIHASAAAAPTLTVDAAGNAASVDIAPKNANENPAPTATPARSEGKGAPPSETVALSDAKAVDQLTVGLYVATDHGQLLDQAHLTL